jgi:hypothetical protein
MTHGGKRSGAGRKAGVPNKLTAQVQAAIAETGETPKDYMLRVMRDETVNHARRDAMAKAVAPYCHPQLQSISANHQIENKYDRMSEDDLIRAICDRANKLGVKIDVSIDD